MQVYQEGDHWVIAQHFSTPVASAVSQRQSVGVKGRRETYAAWTGKRWGWQRSAAMTFRTQEEAQQYLEDNRDRMT